MGDVLQVDNEKQLLKQFYAGQQMESPNGGFLLLLGVRPGDGGATAIFECSATSMRYEIPIPRATRTERNKVSDDIAEGYEPNCPRHGQGRRLVRAGKELICTLCGISYGRV